MAPAPAKVDSVYDFFYVDNRRIGQLLSQFGQDGVLTELTRSAETSAEHGGGLDIKIVKMEGKEGATTALARRFDPQWLLPLHFLDVAQGMIQRDLSEARIGQFVLIKGVLSVLDFNTLKVAWKSPSIKALMTPARDPLPQNATGAQRKAELAAKAEAQQGLDLSLDILQSMPHTIQASVSAGDDAVWCTLGSEGLVSPPSDVLLKYGCTVSGEWTVLGIMDALPDEVHDESLAGMLATIRALEASRGGVLGNMVATLAPIARTMMGRPATSYAITPLLVFREVWTG